MAGERDLNRVCEEIARLLIEERKRQGISMNELASRSGLSQSRISMFEANHGNPTIKTLLRLAQSLDVTLSDVIKRAEKAASKTA